jgi:hypothetical protein
MCFLFSLQLFSETFLILRKTERDMLKHLYRSSCKVPVFLSDFNETWIFSTVFVWNVSHSKMYIGLHVKYPVFLSDFNETWIFSTDFRKMLLSNFMKIRPVRAELFRADRRTDMTKLRVIFRNCANLKMHGTLLPFPDSKLLHVVSCFIIRGSRERIISYDNETTNTMVIISGDPVAKWLSCFKRWS